MWHDLYFPNNMSAIQRRLIKRYDGWYKLYTVLHGYAPNCMYCINYKIFSECFREMLRNNEHPFFGKPRCEACFHFKVSPEMTLADLRRLSPYKKNDQI
jgi:hypothetical protein